MSSVRKSHPLSRAEARRIWLHAQRLETAAPFGEGAQATAAAVGRLGYVQIDTINVIERSHHHILWSRIPGYRRADLRQAQSVDKSVFEYWTHALSYVPTRDMRFFIPAMRRHQREGHKWLSSVKPADLRKVLRLIRRDGALTIRDIDDDVLVDKEHLWASRKPSKRALQLAFYTGVLTISERNGMLKTYELTERHFGWDKPPKPASAQETSAYLLDRALRAQGIVSLDSVCYHDAQSKPDFAAGIYPGYRTATPVPADAPPLFLAIADDDILVAPISAARLYEAWHKADKPIELHIFAKGYHGFGMKKQNLSTDQWIELFKNWLAAQGYLSPAAGG